MQGVHAELASPRLADAILQALSYMTLSSGFLMDKIWTRFKPQYEFENQLVRSLKLLGAFEGSDTPHSDELLHRTLDVASLRALKGESSQTPEEELLANLLPPSDHHPYDEVSEQLIILYPRLLSQCLDKV
ncbi:hypothetical protein FRB91_005708 [Serendipita sp. 411]|nr:hypothetical protein FRB91_005708 [Serendipita sp. 411]